MRSHSVRLRLISRGSWGLKHGAHKSLVSSTYESGSLIAYIGGDRLDGSECIKQRLRKLHCVEIEHLHVDIARKGLLIVRQSGVSGWYVHSCELAWC